MIIQLKGNVKFPITLDPTVWIFDDRKIVLEEAFNDSKKDCDVKENNVRKQAEIFEQEYNRVKPPVNNSIKRFDKKKVLMNSYVMPIKDFLHHAEMYKDAVRAILKTDSDNIVITVEQLEKALLLFALNGKPLIDNGPVHLYFGDGSNKDSPIQNIQQITIE